MSPALFRAAHLRVPRRRRRRYLLPGWRLPKADLIGVASQEGISIGQEGDILRARFENRQFLAA